MIRCFSSSSTLESQHRFAQFFENKVHPNKTPYIKTCMSQPLQLSHLHNYGVSIPFIIIQQKVYSQNFRDTNRKGRKAVRKWVSRARVYRGHELFRSHMLCSTTEAQRRQKARGEEYKPKPSNMSQLYLNTKKIKFGGM